MTSDIFSWIVKSKTGKIATAIYGVGVVIFVLPQAVIGIRHGVPHLAEQYKEAFTGTGRKTEPLPTNPHLPLITRDDADVRKKLAGLGDELARLRDTGSKARIDSLDAAIKELRTTLFGDPERVLTIQRINAEQTSLTSRVDSLQTQMQWLFGISASSAESVG